MNEDSEFGFVIPGGQFACVQRGEIGRHLH
jgi:hypothetical protein